MIHNVSEPEYRAMPELNYSKIKMFHENSRKFYKKHILGESIEDEEDGQEKENLRYGNLVDCLLTTEEEFDYRYQIVDCVEPTGQMKTFVDRLMKNTIAYTSPETGELIESMDVLYDISYREAGIKRDSLEKIKERFIIEGLPYYKALRSRGNKTAITQGEYEKACALVEKLKNHPYSAPLINMVSSERYDVKNQLILTETIFDIPCKGMLDKVIIDNTSKIVYPYDIKTTANGEMFRYNFLKLGYYLQMAMYTLLLRKNFPEYEVKPLSFMVVDKTMYYDPLLYINKEEHLQRSIDGFRLKGRDYKGLFSIMEDMAYCMKHNHFTSSREAHERGGRIEMELFEALSN